MTVKHHDNIFLVRKEEVSYLENQPPKMKDVFVDVFF